MLVPPHGCPYPELDRICQERLQTYGKRLGTWRRQRRVSESGLASLSGMPARRIARIEKGSLPGVTLADMLKLMTVLAIDPAQLFADHHPHDFLPHSR